MVIWLVALWRLARVIVQFLLIFRKSLGSKGMRMLLSWGRYADVIKLGGVLARINIGLKWASQ